MEVAQFLGLLAVMLGTAKLMGLLTNWISQPAVLGELAASVSRRVFDDPAMGAALARMLNSADTASIHLDPDEADIYACATGHALVQ